MEVDAKKARTRRMVDRVVAVFAVLGCVQLMFMAKQRMQEHHEPEAIDAPRYAFDQTVADLVGLQVGDGTYAGWKVEGIPPPNKGSAFIMLGKDRKHFAVGINKLGQMRGMIDTQRYTLSVGWVWPTGSVDMSEAQRVAEYLGKRIRERETAVPAPAGI